jgi:hypothetical protein
MSNMSVTDVTACHRGCTCVHCTVFVCEGLTARVGSSDVCPVQVIDRYRECVLSTLGMLIMLLCDISQVDPDARGGGRRRDPGQPLAGQRVRGHQGPGLLRDQTAAAAHRRG